MFLEVLGLARRQTMMVILPCLVSSGVGAMVFTGLGKWTGLEIGALSHPRPRYRRNWWRPTSSGRSRWPPWSRSGHGASSASASEQHELARTHTMAITVGAGLLTGCLAAVYALVTGHSPAEVALSGQATLATLGVDPESGRRGRWCCCCCARASPTGCAWGPSAAARCSRPSSWARLRSAGQRTRAWHRHRSRACHRYGRGCGSDRSTRDERRARRAAARGCCD